MAERILVAALAAVLLAATAADAQSPPRFPPAERLAVSEPSRPDGDGAWAIARSVSPGLDATIASVRYAGADRVIVTSESGEVALVEVVSGRTVWSQRPFPQSDDPIFCLDVDPAGKRFLSGTAIGGRDDHTSLNVHDTASGGIVARLEEDSRFWQPELKIDHRKPGAAEIQEREAMGLGPNWRVRPIAAHFLGSGRILATFANVMTGPDLYDRSLRLFDASGAGAPRRLWEYQIVADKETYDPDQPAGFKIALPAPRAVAAGDGSTAYYGTAHARIHALDPATVRANAAHAKIEQMTPPPVFANPAAPGETSERLTLGMNDLALGQDGRLLYASAGGAGDAVVLALDVATRTEIARSAPFDHSRIRLGGRDHILVAGHRRGGDSRLRIMDLRSGTLLYLGPRFGALTTQAYDVNATLAEVVVASDAALHFLAPRRVRRAGIREAWTPTGLHLRPGVSLQAFGSGAISLTTRPAEGWSFDETGEIFVGEGDGRHSLPGASSGGEVFARASPPGEWTFVGGLTEAEANDPTARRAGAWSGSSAPEKPPR